MPFRAGSSVSPSGVECQSERSRGQVPLKRYISKMKTYYVYILKCSDNFYYTGVTNDIERRLAEHKEGLNSTAFTYKRRPIQLMFCESFININEAIAFEKQVKGWSRKKKEALIERNWDKLKELAECKNITSHKNYKK